MPYNPPSTEQLVLKIKGLITHPSKFSEAPIGGLRVADNIVINRESIAEPRRGHQQYGTPLPLPAAVDKIFNFNQSLLVHYNNSTIAYDSDNQGTWVPFQGTYNQPDAQTKITTIQSNHNIYFTTDNGVKKIDSTSNPIVESGAPTALGGLGTITGTSGFLSPQTNVAYRLLWGYMDSNKNLVLGAPSQRLVVSNTGTTSANTSIVFDIPHDITTNWIYQLYRSDETTTISSTPDDQMQLVSERNPTAADITNNTITITDITLNELKGVDLYTNASQQSILQTNNRPPFAKDMTIFKNVAFYGNTRTKNRFTVSLIGVGGVGFSIGDTITIHQEVFTGGTVNDPATNTFIVDTSGTPSQNIDSTSLNLISVINKSTTNTNIYSYYLSGFNDIPGKMLFEERGTGGAPFYINSSNTNSFTPQLFPSPDQSNVSDNEVRPNRVYFSKYLQPESVPLVNYFDVGGTSEGIQRIIALRNSVMVFKTDGIYRITSQGASFTVFPFNSSIYLSAVDSAVVLDNKIFLMTDQGVVAVSDSGVAIMSRDIEYELVSLSTPEYINFTTTTFGMAYESERLYILYTVSNHNDTHPTQAFVYNTITQAWTRWTKPFTAGIVSQRDQRSYMASPSQSIYKERKSLTPLDYADEMYSVSITSVNLDQITLSDITNIATGMTITQGVYNSQIIYMDPVTNIITTKSIMPWVVGPANVNAPIPVNLEWLSLHQGNPGQIKHYKEMSLMFDQSRFTSIDLEVSTDFVDAYGVLLLPVPTQRGQGVPWGAFDWGFQSWDGLSVTNTSIIRTYFPLQTQRAHWVNISLYLEEAFSTFSLGGCSIQYSTTSPIQR